MADVTLVLKADNTQYVNTVKEAQNANQKLYDTNEKGSKKQRGLIDQEIERLNILTKSRLKANDPRIIAEYNIAIDKSTKKLKEYEQIGLEANTKIEKSGNSLLTSAARWALGFASVTAAVKIFKDVIESTDALSDKFKATLNGWKEGFSAMSRAIANKDFKDFFKNVKDAVTEGQRFANTQEAIADATRAMMLRVSEGETKILQLREAMAKTTDPKKIAELGRQTQEILKRNAEDRIKIAQAELDNDMKSAAFRTKLQPEILKMYLDQNETLLKRYETGKLLIKEQAELKAAEVGTMGIGIKNTRVFTDEERALMALAIGLNSFIDTQKDKIVSDYEAIESAKQSAINLRVTSKTTTAEIKADKAELNNFDKKLKEDSLAFDKKMRQEREDLGVAEMKRLEKENKDRISEEEKFFKEWETLAEIENKRYQENKEKQKKADEDLYNAKRDLMASAAGLGAVLFDRQFSKLESNYDRETRAAENKFQKDIKLAGDNTKLKEKLEESYNKSRMVREEAYLKRKNELAKKAAIAEKIAGLFSVAIDTAKGVVNAASKVLTIPLIPWIIANAAVQAAIIAAQPIPKFAKGGFIKGRLHSEGGTLIEAERDEFMVRRGPANRFRDVLEAINKDDRKAIYNSFNKLSPELLGGTVNNITVENSGPNNRLDRINSQLHQINQTLQPRRQSREEVIELGNQTIYKKGSSVRIVKR